MASPIRALGLLGRLRRLPSWQLALVAGALFVLSILVPDPVPFVDETLLGLLTLWLSRRRP